MEGERADATSPSCCDVGMTRPCTHPRMLIIMHDRAGTRVHVLMPAPQDLKDLKNRAANQKANSTDEILNKFDSEAKEYRDEMNKKRDRTRRVPHASCPHP